MDTRINYQPTGIYNRFMTGANSTKNQNKQSKNFGSGAIKRKTAAGVFVLGAAALSCGARYYKKGSMAIEYKNSINAKMKPKETFQEYINRIPYAKGEASKVEAKYMEGCKFEKGAVGKIKTTFSNVRKFFRTYFYGYESYKG